MTCWTPARLNRAAAIAMSLAAAQIFLGRGAAQAADLAASSRDMATIETLNSLSLEELSDIIVSSVTKTVQPLRSAPAAIYVITHDDVVRSGATSIPEMLRLAPNLQVAQITSSRYAITARGFNSSAADKLLVLIDGRSVYTPYFSGVMWDLQAVQPDAIERIEVISGPGATLWGANAVNGVINIITRKSEDTQGSVLHVGAGNMEQHASLQHGGKLGEALSYRVYVDGFARGDNRTLTGANAVDGWHKAQAGLRLDWNAGNDLITVQGDGYRGSERSLGTADKAVGGQNLLTRWSRQMADGSALQVQAYYDHLGTNVPGLAANYVTTYDLDVQHSLSWGARQQITWGGGYRLVSDNFPAKLSATQLLEFVPQRRSLSRGNAFVQDTISITDRLDLIAGFKLEKDPYSGVQPLPSLRMSWRRTDNDMVWLAVSRAVRAPSRLDRDLVQRSPAQVFITGGNFQPVKLTAYELGYRSQPSPNLSFSLSSYYNVYRDLRTAEPTNGALPLTFANGMEGETYGVEAWAAYSPTDWWRLSAGFNWLHKKLRFKPGSFGIGGLEFAGNDPDYQVSVRSSMTLAPRLALDLDLRNIGALPAPKAPSYTEMGARLGWAVTDRIELSLTGANLLHARHLETAPTASTLQLGPVGVPIGRSIFLDSRLSF